MPGGGTGSPPGAPAVLGVSGADDDAMVPTKAMLAQVDLPTKVRYQQKTETKEGTSKQASKLLRDNVLVR